MTATLPGHPAPAAAPGGRGRTRSVLVIGAGIGGLATAVRLAHAGYRVTLAEKFDHPGGRAGVWRSEGFTFDTGPSLVMMPEIWQDLFRTVGRRLEDYLTLVQVDPAYRLHFDDGSTFEMTSRLNQLIENFEAVEPGAGQQLLRWLRESGILYHGGVKFIRRNMHRFTSMLNIGTMGPFGARHALGDLQAFARRYFKDQRLLQAVTFQALYLGLSPYRALGVYGLLGHAEAAGGIHYPIGGMHQLAVALARLAAELGVDIRYQTPITRLEKTGGKVTAAITADGQRLTADVVVANSDLPYTYEKLLEEPLPMPSRMAPQFSCSVVLLYLGVNRTYPNLRHHTLAISESLPASCKALFEEKRMPADPPFYVVATTRTDPGQAPPGCENLFCLVLAPSQDPARPIDWKVEGPKVAERTLERMEAIGMPNLRQHIVTQKVITPDHFTSGFGNLRGEAFGLDHGLTQIGWFRPHNRHPKLHNLYFVGQSTHPGCGVPIVLISAECAVERVRQDVPV